MLAFGNRSNEHISEPSAEVELVFCALMLPAQAQIGYNVKMFFVDPERERALTMWATSVTTQTAGTLLIMYRELSTPKYVSSARNSRYCTTSAVLYAIIDSGAVYILGVVFTMSFFVAKRFEGEILSAILGQVAVGPG